ncbi:hypothetical protein MTX26_28080 [Bradyrhizobium sp. ISRA443]|uniref:hypothetical protein n=1 Tax=unclassified Bradyrhizobium TaxID=2631580 RepID=UPI002478B53F|nr:MULTISPECIES: hypothetical protein [unclassified Bradyrhizobium]WGR93552.1 hypothetical protein MTX20_02960 [Bradyrhizobium sp. ISRA435]WGR98103.1 hypothetical protein MTX23_28070 [Bradyrhizobium sp. ISRA436]WGS04992.1 hypothetical protein MTX18_28075 [Bradyrhizobium sp. ISRA437]WGS11876.1 hypothetical protein MTX26_28080 [Bradyrhizobium sp. ISRA443]
MTQNVLLKPKPKFSSNGVLATDPGTPHFSALEIASLRQQLKTSSDKAVAVAKGRGAKLHPRIAALKDQKSKA